MGKNFFEEDEFLEFSRKHQKDIDDTIHSMYQQWKLYTSDNKTIEFFKQPTAVAEEGPPEEFNVELLEKVNGAGFIRVFDPGITKMKEVFVWRLQCDGTIQVALKANEQADPLEKDILAACREMVIMHYDGKTGMKDEQEKEEE